MRRFAFALGLVLWLIAPRSPCATGPLDGEFQIRSAFIVVDRGVLLLNVHVQYPSNERIRAALQDGVTLAFDVQLNITRHRRLWWNASVLDMTLRRELTYHAVTDRYVIRDEQGAEQDSFPTLEDALDRIGRIEGLPVLIASQLHGAGPWQVAVRAGVRRGRLSDTMRALMFWSDAWHRVSDWYTWTLTL
jgi:hypothetical protein